MFQASPLFHFRVLYWAQTKEQKTGEANQLHSVSEGIWDQLHSMFKVAWDQSHNVSRRLMDQSWSSLVPRPNLWGESLVAFSWFLGLYHKFIACCKHSWEPDNWFTYQKSAVLLCWSSQEFLVLQLQIVFSTTWLAVREFSAEINQARAIAQTSPDPLLMGGVWAWDYLDLPKGVWHSTKLIAFFQASAQLFITCLHEESLKWRKYKFMFGHKLLCQFWRRWTYRLPCFLQCDHCS